MKRKNGLDRISLLIYPFKSSFSVSSASYFSIKSSFLEFPNRILKQLLQIFDARRGICDEINVRRVVADI